MVGSSEKSKGTSEEVPAEVKESLESSAKKLLVPGSVTSGKVYQLTDNPNQHPASYKKFKKEYFSGTQINTDLICKNLERSVNQATIEAFWSYPLLESKQAMISSKLAYQVSEMATCMRTLHTELRGTSLGESIEIECVCEVLSTMEAQLNYINNTNQLGASPTLAEIIDMKKLLEDKISGLEKILNEKITNDRESQNIIASLKVLQAKMNDLFEHNKERHHANIRERKGLDDSVVLKTQGIASSGKGRKTVDELSGAGFVGSMFYGGFKKDGDLWTVTTVGTYSTKGERFRYSAEKIVANMLAQGLGTHSNPVHINLSKSTYHLTMATVSELLKQAIEENKTITLSLGPGDHVFELSKDMLKSLDPESVKGLLKGPQFKEAPAGSGDEKNIFALFKVMDDMYQKEYFLRHSGMTRLFKDATGVASKSGRDLSNYLKSLVSGPTRSLTDSYQPQVLDPKGLLPDSPTKPAAPPAPGEQTQEPVAAPVATQESGTPKAIVRRGPR